MTGDGPVMTMTILVRPKSFTVFNKFNEGTEDKVVPTPDTVATILNTPPSASSKNKRTIGTPKLERQELELFEASYATPANSICNAICPVWYGTLPPTRNSPWATDVCAMFFPHIGS